MQRKVLSSIKLEVLASARRHEKEIQDIGGRKNRLFMKDMIVHEIPEPVYKAIRTNKF